MPEITAETPRADITIAGKSFSVPQPYAEGHALTPNEASALNQTYAENVRNNRAKLVKEAIDAGTFDQDVFQGQVDDYCDDYEFGVRTGGGRSGDPVRQEAMAITRDLVRKAIVKQGKALKDYSAAKISELAKAQLDSGSEKALQILAIARQRVESTREAELDLDVGDAQADAPAATKSKKAPAQAEG